MKIWSVTNQKGGVGKTTSAVSLAGAQALLGQRTLLIDLDPQGSLSTYFGINPEKTTESIYEVFTGEQINRKSLTQLIRPTDVDNLFIIPASLRMATLDRKISSIDGKGLVVSHCLEYLTLQFDHIYLDCPPTLGVLMINALAACDHIIVPVQTEFLAVNGLRRMQSTINMIEQSRGFKVDYTIVPTLFDQRTRASMHSLDTLEQDFNDFLSQEIIPVDTTFRDASLAGLPISHYGKRSRGAIAYQNLCIELEKFESVNQKVESI